MRLEKKQLEQIKNKYQVDTIWSWSRFHAYEISPFEYFLKYVVHKKPDRANSAYVVYGAICHEIVEKYYQNQITFEDMKKECEDQIFMIGLGDYKFNRVDDVKDQQIKEQYIDNIKLFFEQHNHINDDCKIELPIRIKIGNFVFVGYIDMFRKDKDGNFIIQDWKTSTIYKGKKIDEEAAQLLLYAEGARQQGVPIDKIKCCWNFVKYVDVTYEQANGKLATRQIERNKIGEKLSANVKMWLKKFGYKDEIELYINKLKETNSLSELPNEVQDKYNITDCYVYIPFTDETLKDLKLRILNTLPEIVNKTNEYADTLNEALFYDDMENVKKESFYFANLCEYSANLHKPYANYLKSIEEKDNVFAGVGEEKNNTNVVENQDDELAWLNEI